MNYPPAPPVVVAIQQLVCERFGLSRDALLGPRSAHRISHPRQIAMALCDSLNRYSVSAIGRYFDRDHTTVLYALNAVRSRCREDEQYRTTYETLRASCATFGLDLADVATLEKSALNLFDTAAAAARARVAEHPAQFLMGGLGALLWPEPDE